MRVAKTRGGGLQHARIRKVAVRLFGRNGFNATSMRDLAEATGLKAASLYSHLVSKNALLFEVLDDMADRFLEGAREIHARPLTAEKKLRALFRFHVQAVTENLEAATVHFHEYRHLSGDAYKKITQKRAAYSEVVSAILKQGVAEGSFRKIDLSLTTLQILSVLNYVYHWYSPRGRKSAEALGDTFAETFLRGVRKGGE